MKRERRYVASFNLWPLLPKRKKQAVSAEKGLRTYLTPSLVVAEKKKKLPMSENQTPAPN